MSSYRNIRDLIAHLAKTDPQLYEALNRLDSQLSEPDILTQTVTTLIATSNTGWVKSGSNIRLDSPGDFVGVGTSAPTKRFSVANLLTIDDNGRMFSHTQPSYDLTGGVRAVSFFLDPAGQAGNDALPYGGEFNFPSGGLNLELIRLTGQLGSNALGALSEFSMIRMEGKNNGPDLNSSVRGIIGSITMDGGGHIRTSYMRANALVGSTGYMTASLSAVAPAAAQPTGNAIGHLLYCDGSPNVAYGLQISNDPGKGWFSGIVFDDFFEGGLNAIRLRQSPTNGRVQWGSSGPYVESGSGSILEMAMPAGAVFVRDNGASGTYGELGSATEEVTLSTIAATTDSVANLLPANSIIRAVVARVTQAITGAGVTNWRLGDATTDNRFTANIAGLAAGTTTVGTRHWDTSLMAAAVGPRQNLAAPVRITVTGALPTAGRIRLVVFYETFGAPTS